MLRGREGHKHKGFSSKLNYKQLPKENAHHNGHEQVIISNVDTDVGFLFGEFSGIEKVENLQEHEHIEEYTKMHTSLIVPVLRLQPDGTLNAKNFRSPEENNHQDANLENSTN